MDIANLVQATAGREQGKYFFVLETDGEYLLLADGKSRRIEHCCALLQDGKDGKHQPLQGITLGKIRHD